MEKLKVSLAISVKHIIKLGPRPRQFGSQVFLLVLLICVTMPSFANAYAQAEAEYFEEEEAGANEPTLLFHLGSDGQPVEAPVQPTGFKETHRLEPDSDEEYEPYVQPQVFGGDQGRCSHRKAEADACSATSCRKRGVR